MSEFTIKTLRAVYLQNLPYKYPLPVYNAAKGGMYFHPIETGWQVLPNILWGHYASPRQFYEMVINYEAIKVVGATATVFNMIPIQTQLAIQGTTTFNAFNNTIYAWGYNDELYETPPFNWYEYYMKDNQLYTAYKEGAYPTGSYNPQPQPGNNEWLNHNLYGNLVDYRWCDEGSAGTPKKSDTDPKPKDVQDITLTRQRLPVYAYDFPFNKKYLNINLNSASTDETKKNQAKSQMAHFMSEFGGARVCGMTGAFWDPLNRPEAIMELRPGKNAIKFSWTAHETDQNHWFNTDAVALQWPYSRDSTYNQRVFDWTNKLPGWNQWRPSRVDPREAGNCGIDPSTRTASAASSDEGFEYEYWRDLEYKFGLPWDYQNLPDWSKLPIVPCNWFKEEISKSNPCSTNKYEDKTTWTEKNNDGKNDATEQSYYTITSQIWDICFPGTEYEQYKYPPTQWFMKMVPLFDSNNALITLEAQVFIQLELHIIGKPRRSAIFCPTWGPWPPQNLYSADPNGKFNLSIVRGRSGGARRTWLSNDLPGWIPNPAWELNKARTQGVYDFKYGPPNPTDRPELIQKKDMGSITRVEPGTSSAWVKSFTQNSGQPSTVTVTTTSPQTQSP